jgi:hypothetical protein
MVHIGLLMSLLSQFGAHDVVWSGNQPTSSSLGADLASSHLHSELSVSFQSDVRSMPESPHYSRPLI